MEVSSVSSTRAFDISLVNKAMQDAVDKTLQHNNRLLRFTAGAKPEAVKATTGGNADAGQIVDTVA